MALAMEKIAEDSITKKPLSPNDEQASNDKIDLTPEIGTIVATTEGGEGIEQPSASDSVQEEPKIEMSNVENHNEELAGSGVISHKRKLSEDEGEFAIEKESDMCSLPNDPATQKNEIKSSNAQMNEVVGPSVAQERDEDAKRARLDLNVPITDEDDGGAVEETVNANVDSPPTHGLQQAPQGREVDEKVENVNSPPALGLQLAPQGGELEEKVRDNEDWTPPTLGLPLAPEGGEVVDEEVGGNEDSPYEFRAEESEAGSSSLNKNDVESSPARIYDFDLNEPLADEDEDEA